MDIFTRFKNALQIREILVDNEVFQLHYRVTAILLLGCAALVASKQHFGDPIDCITRDDVPNKIMDTYCWIHATFTLMSACNKTVGSEVPHPCVDSFTHDKEERVYHKYYQWVYFVLFFQSACFYAPHLLWKTWESKLLYNITNEMKKPLIKMSDDEKETVALISNYLDTREGRHMSYYYRFVFCETLNFINVVLQIYLVDEFLGGSFTNYGFDVINYVQMDQDDRVDPMVRVFPRLTKCTFHRYGSSGDIQRYDALCLLPLNIINEKIYIVMWFWFLFLALVTGLWLVYRVSTFFRPDVRFRVLNRRATACSKSEVSKITKRLDPGDWFLMSMMCKNMDCQWFKAIVSEVVEKRRKKREKEEESIS